MNEQDQRRYLAEEIFANSVREGEHTYTETVIRSIHPDGRVVDGLPVRSDTLGPLTKLGIGISALAGKRQGTRQVTLTRTVTTTATPWEEVQTGDGNEEAR